MYHFLKRLVRIGFRVFYKKIYITNTHNIPKDGGKFIAANHPTAFLDPMLFPTQFPMVTHFILRGDVFVSPLVNSFLKTIKTIPIFRQRDGADNMKKNVDTFEYVQELLHHNSNVVIMAEGIMAYEKRLRTIKKGTARMMIGTYEKYQKEDLYVIPVGINYTDSYHPRTYVMVDVGEPIRFQDYLEIYKKNDRRAIKLITDEITKQLKQRIIHIDKREDDDFINQILDINRNDFTHPIFPIKADDGTLLENELKVVHHLNNLSEEEKNAQKEALATYSSLLKQHDIEDIALAKPRYANLKTTLFLIIGFVPYLIGKAINFVPFKLGRYIADKKVTAVGFYSSVLFGAGLFGYLFYMLFWALVLAIVDIPYLNGWAEFGLLWLMPVFSYFAIVYGELGERWWKQLKGNRLGKNIKKELQEKREQFINYHQ